MGQQGSPQEFMPVQLNVKIKGAFLGTRINGECSQEFAYTRIGTQNFTPDSCYLLLTHSTLPGLPFHTASAGHLMIPY